MTALRNQVAALARRSVAIIAINQASTGAYIASPNFPVYRYSWFRDGAFIADAMSRAGHGASAEAFFRWCTAVLVARSAKIDSLIRRHRAGETIAEDEFLHARYTTDGQEVAATWWNFQLDGYGTWLWALAAHLRPGELSTLAPLYAGLLAATALDVLPDDLCQQALGVARHIRETVLSAGRRDGRLAKWLGGDAVDASLIACGIPFGLVDPADPLMTGTIQAIESTLAHGGVHRYLQDTYYGGGEWPLLAALLGWHYATVGRLDEAHAQLAWIVQHASGEGDLSEQVADHLLAPSALPNWVERWGPVASPLLWSHAMFLTLALELRVVTAPIR